jgi:DNA repair protein SbcC/Rad50
MRFDAITLRGFGPFDDELTIDLRERQGRIVAVTGPNGSGKSTLLELLAGALYRRMPTRGALKDFATSRDSLVEVRLQNGAPWTVRQRIDAVSGKGEAEVLDGEGRPVLASTKVREADAWIADHFPSADVLYASAFGAQGSAGFLDLDPTARKRVILATLGHTHLEQLAKAAGEQARAAKVVLDTLVARVADERERGVDEEGAAARLAEATTLRAEAEAEHKAAQEAFRLVHVEQTVAKQTHRDRAATEQKRRELEERRDTISKQVADLEERAGNNEGLLAAAKEIRGAAADVERLEDESTLRAAYRRDALSAATNARANAGQETSLAKSARDAEANAKREVEVLEKRLTEREALTATAAKHEGCLATLAEAKAHLDRATAEVERLERLRIDGKDQRIVGLRGGLDRVFRLEGEPTALAEATLLADEDRAKQLEAAPDAIVEAKAEQSAARAGHADAVLALNDADKAREQLAAFEGLDEQLEERKASARHYAEQATQHDAEAKVQRGAADDAHAQCQRLDDATAKGEAALQTARRLARRVGPLEAAEARLEELRPQLDGARAGLTAVEEQLVALGELAPLPPIPDTTAVGEDERVAASALRKAEAAEAVRKAEVANAKGSTQRLAELNAKRRNMEEALADWRLLERDLGRDGIQALEADAAGPELTELANDLLHTCLGPRFSVRIETVRPKKGGKGEREGCWVAVHDAEAGREDDAKTFSGGERVLVGEAVNLALTMLGVRRAGLSEPTIVRDETGAALDGVNGRAYIAMLRRAAELVGAPQVLFVAHDPALWEMADDRIDLGPGREAA